MALFSFPKTLRHGHWLASSLLLTVAGPALFAQTASPSANDGYDPNVTGIVNALALQPNGQVVIGGTFTSLQPNGAAGSVTRNNLARVNTDGSLDTTFDPEPNGPILAILVQPNGQILIGGGFTTLQPNGAATTTARNHLARLNADGSIDSTFASTSVQGQFTTTGQVNAIALQSNGQILIGGSFITVGGAPHDYIARLNTSGSVDGSFSPVVDAQVDAICVESNGQILIGGAFTSLGTIPAPGSTITTASGVTYIGTTITTASGGTYYGNHMGRLNSDGSVDQTFDPDVNNQVSSIAVQPDGEILLCGYFSTILTDAATPTTADFIARLNPDGTPDGSNLTDPSWVNPAASSGIQTLALQSDGKILIGGNIGPLTTGGVGSFSTAPYAARLNQDGSPDTTFSPGPNYLVNALAVQSDGKIVMGGQFNQFKSINAHSGTTRNGVARVNVDGTLDGNFDPNAYGGIGVFTTQSNGQILIGGSFASVDGVTRGNMARLNTDGTLDTTFNPNFNGPVGAIVIQPNGQIIVGGNFTTVDPGALGNPVLENFLVRLNTDGSLDTTWNPDPNGAINALVLQPNGQLLVAGGFSQFQQNGTTTVPATTNVTFTVSVPGTPTYQWAYNTNPISGAVGATYSVPNVPVTAAGTYTVTVTYSSTSATSYSTTLGVTPAPAVKTTVNQTINVTGPQVIEFVARLNTDGGVDGNFQPNPSAIVNCILLDPSDNAIIIGGSFQVVTPAVNGIASTANFVARLNATDGTIDTTFNPNPNGTVRAMAMQTNGQIILGGSFSGLTPNPVTTTSVVGSTVVTTTTPTTTRSGIARINVDGTLDTNFDPEANDTVLSIAINPTNGQIGVGGNFTNIGGVPRMHAARVNTDGSTDAGFSPSFNGFVDSVQFGTNNQILVGGSFTTVTLPNSTTATPADHMARFNGDGSLDTTFKPAFQVPTQISTMVVQPNGQIIIGGSFVNTAGNYATNMVRLNGDTSQDTSFAPNPNGPVNVIIAQEDGTCYAGGSFQVIGGGSATNFAHVNVDGSIDSTFNASTDGPVDAVAVEGTGQVIIGGAFAHADSTARTDLARLNTNGTLDPTFNPVLNGAVTAVVLQPSTGKILIGGSFTTVGGAARNNLARLNLDGSLDATWNPNANGAISAVVLQPSSNQILISGAFTSVAGVARNHLARLNVDGTLDQAYNPNVGGTVSALVLQTDGSAIVGGSFTSVGGVARSNLARVISTGAIDSNFNPGPDGAVISLAIQGDGKPLVAGSFANIGGQPRAGFARLSATAAAVQAITVSSDLSTLTWSRGGPGPEASAVIFSWSTDDSTWTILGQGTYGSTSTAPSTTPLVSGANGVWTLGGITSLPGSTDFYVQAQAITPTSENGSAGLIQIQQAFYIVQTQSAASAPGATGGTVPPVVVLAPALSSSAQVAAAVGAPFYYAIAAANSPTSATVTGLPPGMTMNPTSDAISGTPTQAGTFVATLTLANAGGTTLVPLQISVAAGTAGAAAVSPTARLINLSSRAGVTAVNPLSDGFIIAGSAPKTVLLRAVGPGLATLGVSGSLPTPVLQLFDSSGRLVLTGRAWDGSASLSQIFTQLGAFPLAAGSADVAVVTSLTPGAYTLSVAPASGTSGGTVLAEIYDADSNPLTLVQRLVNLSGRAAVDPSDTLVGGFVISGSAPKTVLVRAVGPTLVNYGVGAPLPAPVLAIFDSKNNLLAQNTGWNTPVTVNAAQPAASAASLAAAATGAGAFPLTAGSADSAVLVTLAPGVYTGQVTGAGGQTGIALFEVYEVPGGN